MNYYTFVEEKLEQVPYTIVGQNLFIIRQRQRKTSAPIIKQYTFSINQRIFEGGKECLSLQILFLYQLHDFYSKIMKSWFLLLLLSICSLSIGQVLISRCNICQKCTYCAGDILYDCNVDSIYSSIINRNPSIVRAFPINISKKQTALGAIYDFRFSNNQNVTYQIRSKQATSTSASQQVTATPKQQTLINQTTSSSGQISKSTNQAAGEFGSSQVLTASWKAVQNASDVILQYSIKHFYLSISSIVESVAQETGLNTYTAIVRSQGSRIKMNAYIEPEDLSLKVLSLVFLSGSLQDATKGSSLSSSGMAGVGDKPVSIAGTSTQKIEGITIRKGLSVSRTLQEGLKYLVGIYKDLLIFQLDSYSTIDNVVYSLNFTNILDSNIRYTFRVMAMAPVKSSNLRVDTQNSYQIMDYQLVNTSNNASFTNLNTPQLLYSDSYAETVLNQMNKDVLAPLKLLSLKLVNISSSIPFYILNYEEESKLYRFLVSYDVLTGKIRVIDEKIADKNVVLSSQSLSNQLNKKSDGQKTENVNQNISIAVDSVLNFDDSKLIPVKKVTVNTSITDSIPKPAIVTPSQPITPQPVPPVQLPTTSPTIPQPPSVKLNYINFRTDAVFIKALTVINTISSLSTSNIIQVSQQSLSSGNMVKYIITVNYNLPSGRVLEINADYNTQSNTVTFPLCTYTPQTILMKNMFENISLSSISSNKVIMDIISSIFMDNPQYFSTAVSSVKEIYAYPPYFNLTYENSVYGVIGFDCEYNYFNRQTKIISYNIPQKPIGNVGGNIVTVSNQNSIKDNAAQKVESVTKPAENTLPTQSASSQKDIFCLTSDGSRCQQCTFRFYIDSQTFRCKPVPDQCYIFDYFQLQCSKCFSGYSLANGTCRL